MIVTDSVATSPLLPATEITVNCQALLRSSQTYFIGLECRMPECPLISAQP